MSYCLSSPIPGGGGCAKTPQNILKCSATAQVVQSSPERATVLLCAVHCCTLLCAAARCVSSGLDATHTHSSPRGLPPKSSPCKISSKHKQQSRFRAATARAGHGHPRRRMASRAAGGVELIHRGVLLQVVHQQRHRAEPVQPTGLTRPTSAARSECSALAPTPAGPANSVNG